MGKVNIEVTTYYKKSLAEYILENVDPKENLHFDTHIGIVGGFYTKENWHSKRVFLAEYIDIGWKVIFKTESTYFIDLVKNLCKRYAEITGIDIAFELLEHRDVI